MLPEAMDSRISDFERELMNREKADATVQKYVREIRAFFAFLNSRELTKEILLEYRVQLCRELKPQTVNGKLIALNGFLEYMNLSALRIRLLRVQHKSFVDERREMSECEYRRLLSAAKARGNDRLYHVMLTICGTGIRVSELQYITAEAVRRGRAEIALKGKNRTILINRKLKARLLQYGAKHGIVRGCLFRTRNGKPLDRSNICHEMKKLCREARVDSSKVFPHNFRHLFARCFFSVERNLAHLADILGHSSIETTRIYVAVSAREHERILEKMGLVT